MADEKLDIGAYSQSIRCLGANSGTYTWLINDKSLIRNILNAENGKLFESKPFIMRNMRWSIRLYPNGNKKEKTGDVVLCLKLLSIPQVIDAVVLYFLISCDKTFTSGSHMKHFTQTNVSWGCTLKSLLSEWKSMNAETLSITVNINVITVILKKTGINNIESIGLLPHVWINKKPSFPKKCNFEYKFDSNTINMFKKSYVGKGFTSNIIDNTWRLKIYPNGNKQDNEGNIGVFLTLCWLPSDTAEITVKYSVKCSETDHNFSCQGRIFKCGANSWGPDKFIPLSTLCSLNQLTFIVSAEILNMKKKENIECVISDSIIIDRIFSLHSCDNINEEHKLDSVNIQQQLTEKDERMQELSSTMISMQNIINKKSEQIQKLTNQITSIQQETADNGKTMQNMIDTKEKTVQELTNKIRNMESYVFDEKRGNEEKENNINNVTTSILLLQQQIRINKKSEQMQQLTNQQETANNAKRIQQMQNMIDTKEKTVKDLKNEMDSINNNEKEMSHSISRLQNLIATKDKTAQQLTNKITNMESYVFAEKKGNDEKENNINNLTTSMLLLQQQIKEMQKDININKENIHQNPGQKQLKSWLINVVKLPQYFDIFVEEGFEDLQSVKYVTANELTSMGITKIAHKMKLLRFIAKLNDDNQQNEGNTGHFK